MSKKNLDISVVIPALNEGRNIGPLVERINAAIKELNLEYEVIIVDGGSSDETWQVAESLGARCILQRRLGYAGALIEGFKESLGSYVLTMDCDLSHPPELLKELWLARDSADILVGSRFSDGGKSSGPVVRHVLSGILNFIFSYVLKLPVKDLSSGYRLYKREAINLGPYEPEHFNILQEVLVRSYSDGYSIKELPLHYQERASGSSHVSLVKFAISYLPTLYRLWKLRNSLHTADYEYLTYFSRHPLQRYWARSRVNFIREYLGEGEKVLDVGSGSNYLTTLVPGVIALDTEDSKLRFLKQKKVEVRSGNAEDLPFEDASFDKVILSQVLSYVDNAQLVVKEVNRVLKVNGELIIAVPDVRRVGWLFFGTIYKFLPNVRESHIKVKHEFSRSTLVDLLADHGFRALKYKYILGSELILKCKKVEELGKK
jgi:dolichol-phosphate mannosyltransferase